MTDRAANLTHIDESGDVQMVDISEKEPSSRMAVAEGFVTVHPRTINAIRADEITKGSVLATAKIAGIQAAKKCADLIPLCHPLHLSWVDLHFTLEDGRIRIRSTVKTREATGVEMEALTAVSISALTIYDMCKAIDKEMEIGPVSLLEKRGGKRDYMRSSSPGGHDDLV
jgi:cyclic pyranopterin monophosphate synthase